MRNASYQDIAVAQAKVNTKLTSLEFLFFFEPWLPVIDNNIIKGQTIELVNKTSFPLKPLIIGTVTDEGLFFIYEVWTKPITLAMYIEILTFTFHERAFKVMERYPPDEADDQRPNLSKIATQWVFACPTRFYARTAASYSYVFGFPLDFNGWENETFCNNHVCHAGELPYTFESTWANFTDTGKRIATGMATYWTNFAKSHDPNQPVSWPIVWPKANTNETYLYFQDPLDIRKAYLKDDCDFWDQIGYK